MIEYAAIVRENVAKHGFHVTYVDCDETPSFCYSTGIYQTFSIPEIFISSLPPELSHELISQYIQRHSQNGPPLNQCITAIDERFDYYLIPVAGDRLKEYVLASFKFYGQKPFDYLQLIYPDTDLLFPDQVGYDYDQEILGQFPPLPGA
jgi:hypothetical protein